MIQSQRPVVSRFVEALLVTLCCYIILEDLMLLKIMHGLGKKQEGGFQSLVSVERDGMVDSFFYHFK